MHRTMFESYQESQKNTIQSYKLQNFTKDHCKIQYHFMSLLPKSNLNMLWCVSITLTKPWESLIQRETWCMNHKIISLLKNNMSEGITQQDFPTRWETTEMCTSWYMIINCIKTDPNIPYGRGELYQELDCLCVCNVWVCWGGGDKGGKEMIEVGYSS